MQMLIVLVNFVNVHNTKDENLITKNIGKMESLRDCKITLVSQYQFTCCGVIFSSVVHNLFWSVTNK